MSRALAGAACLATLVVACHGRTKVPTEGAIHVSGTCGAQTGKPDEQGYGPTESNADGVSVQTTIEEGTLTRVRVETHERFSLSQPDSKMGVMFAGEVRPRLPLVVGQWVALDVPVQSEDVNMQKANVRVRIRVMGEEIELDPGDGKIQRGPCSWGSANGE